MMCTVETRLSKCCIVDGLRNINRTHKISHTIYSKGVISKSSNLDMTTQPAPVRFHPPRPVFNGEKLN